MQGVTDYAIYMLDPEGHGDQLERGCAADQGLHARTRSSGSTSRRSTPPRIARPGCRTQALRDRRARGPVREGGLARPQGRHAASGRMSSSIRIRDDDGDLIGFAKITRDLTERKVAQEPFG